MNKDKQIEEMAKELNDMSGIITKRCENRRFISSMSIAEALYNAGYRKASEIFEEIETSLSIADFKGNEVYYAIRAEDYLHYKKKYTESERDNV